MKGRFRVAMLAACPFPTSQGSQVLIRQLAETLWQRGHQVTVLSYHLRHGDPDPAVPIVRTPSLPGYGKLGSGPTLWKLFANQLLALRLARVARDGIDLVHAHNYEGAMIGSWVGRRLGIPVIYHSHSTLEDELPTYFRSPLLRWGGSRAGRLFDGTVPRWVDYTLALTPAACASFVARPRVPEDRVAWVPPGIRYEEPRPEAVVQMAQRLGVDGRPLIVYTGNLDAYQRLDLLRASLPWVFGRFPEAVMLIATHAPRIRGEWDGDKRVIVLPGVSFDEVRALLCLATVTVLPRTSPFGFPIKLLNYMAAGKAVVAFRGVASFVANPPCAYLVGEETPEALADGIVALLQDRSLREALSTRARRVARERYNWECVGQQIETVYHRLIRGRNVRREESAEHDGETLVAHHGHGHLC